MKEKQSIIKFLILAVILAVALTAGFATGAMKTAALTADWTLSLRAILRLAAMAAGVLLAEWVAEFFLTLCKPRTHRARPSSPSPVASCAMPQPLSSSAGVYTSWV